MAQGNTGSTDAPGTGPAPNAGGESKADAPFTNPAGGGGGSSSSGGGGGDTGLGPMTAQQIADAANTQIQNQINDQTNPLNAQIGTLGTQQANTIAGIQSMFGSILPYASQESQAVTDSYNQAMGQEAAIFSAANVQMNQLRQQRAAEAQALAQQMGGPVAVSDFTAAVDPDATLLARQGPTQMLHTLMFAQAGEQAARAFSGQVLPMVQVEQEAKARAYYQDQIKQLQDQITSIQSQKGSQVQQAINDMTVRERQYQLDLATQKLNALNAQRDWRDKTRSFNEQVRKDNLDNKLAQQAQADSHARTVAALKQATASTALTNAQITHLGKADALAAKQLGLTKMEYAARLKQIDASTKVNTQKLAASRAAEYSAYLDAAVQGSPGKSITYSQLVPITRATAAQDPKDAIKMKGSASGYGHLVKITQQSGLTTPITDPGALVDYLVAHQVPKKVAVNMVKSRLRLPNWSYGQADPRGATAGYAGTH